MELEACVGKKVVKVECDEWRGRIEEIKIYFNDNSFLSITAGYDSPCAMGVLGWELENSGS